MNTSLNGEVFYRETSQPCLLEKFYEQALSAFRLAALDFFPTQLFIVTWRLYSPGNESEVSQTSCYA